MRRQAFNWGLVLLVLLALAFPVTARAQETADEDESDSDQPPTLETDPLEARFGGTRANFEGAYGEPSKPDAGDYPRGDDYRIDGYKRVSVFYDEDRVVHLSLYA